MSPARRIGGPSAEMVIVEVGMIVFVTVMIVVSHLTLGPSARLVPLIVGYPTLLLLLYQFLDDLGVFAGTTRPADGSRLSGESGLGADLEAAMEVLDEEAGESDEVDMRRYALFGVWSVGFVALAVLTSFLVAVPVALFVILWEATGGWLKALAIVVPTSIVLFLVFDSFLQVPW